MCVHQENLTKELARAKRTFKSGIGARQATATAAAATVAAAEGHPLGGHHGSLHPSMTSSLLTGRRSPDPEGAWAERTTAGHLSAPPGLPGPMPFDPHSRTSVWSQPAPRQHDPHQAMYLGQPSATMTHPFSPQPMYSVPPMTAAPHQPYMMPYMMMAPPLPPPYWMYPHQPPHMMPLYPYPPWYGSMPPQHQQGAFGPYSASETWPPQAGSYYNPPPHYPLSPPAPPHHRPGESSAHVDSAQQPHFASPHTTQGTAANHPTSSVGGTPPVGSGGHAQQILATSPLSDLQHTSPNTYQPPRHLVEVSKGFVETAPGVASLAQQSDGSASPSLTSTSARFAILADPLNIPLKSMPIAPYAPVGVATAAGLAASLMTPSHQHHNPSSSPRGPSSSGGMPTLTVAERILSGSGGGGSALPSPVISSGGTKVQAQFDQVHSGITATGRSSQVNSIVNSPAVSAGGGFLSSGTSSATMPPTSATPSHSADRTEVPLTVSGPPAASAQDAVAHSAAASIPHSGIYTSALPKLPVIFESPRPSPREDEEAGGAPAASNTAQAASAMFTLAPAAATSAQTAPAAASGPLSSATSISLNSTASLTSPTLPPDGTPTAVSLHGPDKDLSAENENYGPGG